MSSDEKKMKEEIQKQLKEARKKEREERVMDGVGAGVGAVASAAGTGVRKGRDFVNNMFQNQEFILIAILGFITIVIDWQLQWARTPDVLPIIGTLYMIVCAFIFFALRHEGADIHQAMSFSVRLFAFSFLFPVMLNAFTKIFYNTIQPSVSVPAFLAVLIASEFLPMYLWYFFGLPRWFFEQVGRRWRIFAWIGPLLTVTLLIMLLMPIWTTMALSNSFGEYGAPVDIPSRKEMFNEVIGTWKDFYERTQESAEDRYKRLLEAATPTYYTGEVERQQGAPLGVFVQNLQPLQPRFNYEVTGNGDDAAIRLGVDNYVTWFGTIHARTFADLLDVNISCAYVINDSDKIILPARPDSLSVAYTGEFVDTYDFDCRIPMGDDGIFPYINTGRGLYGRFFVFTDFNFDTWGYTTWTFMDREEYLALRREGIEPASHLGIERTARAIYTPGPISLGLERQQQPIYVSVSEPDLNNMLRFGVTIQNAWQGRGDVNKIHYLVLQLPEPFTLDYDECVGIESDYVEILTEGELTIPDSIDGAVIPNGYVGYRFSDINLTEHQYKTLSCPISLGDGDPGSWDWSSLLGQDLSPRQFTFVVQTNYDYRGEQPVGVSLGVTRFS